MNRTNAAWEDPEPIGSGSLRLMDSCFASGENLGSPEKQRKASDSSKRSDPSDAVVIKIIGRRPDFVACIGCDLAEDDDHRNAAHKHKARTSL
jgi:hypothetical protein